MRNQELHPRTAVINKSQKNKSRKCRMEALTWLAQNFPEAFDNSVVIRPLKNGIMDDILECADKAEEAGVSKSKLREAVVLYTRRVDYLACLKAKEMRVDLFGNPVEPVTDADAERAALKIKKRVEKSVKNARKNLVKNHGSIETTYRSPIRTYTPMSHHAEEPVLPIYPHRAPTTPVSQPGKAENVVVKKKSARQFDPDTVERLKAKLGLRKAAAVAEEMVGS